MIGSKIAGLSLRNKLVLTLTSVVTIVSIFAVTISSRMFVDDKQAYLYDNVMANLESGSSSLQVFFEGKRNMILSYYEGINQIEERLDTSRAYDADLFRVTSYQKEIEKTLYRNKRFLDEYKSQEDFILVDLNDFVASNQFDSWLNGQYQEKVYIKDGAAPRLIFILYRKSDATYFVFEYMFDHILNKIFEKSSLEVALTGGGGETIYYNRPVMGDYSYRSFFTNKANEIKGDAKNRLSSGVSESRIGENDYIFGHKKIMGSDNLLIFSGVSKSDAFKVTRLLIFNTGLYATGLVFIFSICSIFLARSITNPLSELTETTKKIADGDFSARLEGQKTQELKVVANAFNVMIEKIHEYNQTLEQKVRERTQELSEANKFIKTVVDSVGQGLLVFDQTGRCHDLYTNACEKLLGVNPSGKMLPNVIKSPNPDLTIQWVDTLFQEMIPFESMIELGQKSVPTTLSYEDDGFQHVELEFYPIRNEDEQIENVVLLATDKTKEFKSSKALEKQQAYVELVSKVVKDKNNFLRFYDLFTNSMKELIHQVTTNIASVSKSDVMRLLHSMKGSAGFYSLNELVHELHTLESDIGGDEFHMASLAERSQRLIDQLDHVMETLQDFLQQTNVSVVDVEETKLRAFYMALKPKVPKLAVSFADYFLRNPAEKYIGPYKDLWIDLAGKLGKDVNPLMVVNGDIKIDVKFYQEFFDSCIHLFRNALDHGIETSGERIASGKKAKGSIKVTFKTMLENDKPIFVTHIQDDGRGISAERIREKMRELNYPEQSLKQTDDKIIYHIFDEAFSTAETITHLSGRGVGLFDLKSIVEKLGGRLEVKTKIKQGSLFSFYLPYV